MRFASLGSGSKGNCLLAEAGNSRLLLDCGLGPRETARRLGRLGVEPSGITGIIVTHEHDDHVGGVFAFAAQHRLPVWLTHGTWRAAIAAGKAGDDREVSVNLIDGRNAFAVGDLQVQPFTVPHDAREPVQFVISDGAFHLGVLTDIGASTAHVEAALSGCDALVLECNHDLDMLHNSGYPKWLQERIAGPFGHLDNRQAADLLARLDRSRLQHLIGAHLSQQNNLPDLARRALAGAMNCEQSWVSLATQQEGFDWRELK
ncbi:MAG: MBL fold metallo-hydrolase [Betaproteobacteria bacterium]|nr:MBL fold metallo-hydrolase [Betaproteobacteria bacterium]